MAERNARVPVSVNFQVIGLGHRQKEAITEAVVAALAKAQGRWQVQLIGGREDKVWELRVSGPGVETSNYLDGSAGEQTPEFIASAVRQIAFE